jgi:hypothetical protein
MADEYDADAGEPEPDEENEPSEPDYRSKGAEGDHQLALERLQVAASAVWRQAEREKAALRYQVPALMWSTDAKSWRAGEDLGGGIVMPDRPMIAIPKIEQAVRLVLNQERAAHLGVTFHPESETAEDETAETMTGLYRQIDRESRAGLARSWGFNRAVKAGRGAWRVVTEPAADYEQTKDQNIRIKRILYQDAVYFDPFATEPDFSDGEHAFVLEWVSWAKYKQLYKRVKKTNAETGKVEDLPSALAEMSDGDLTKLAEDAPEWIRGEGEARAVLVAEYLCIERRPKAARDAKKAGWLADEQRRTRSRWMNAVEFMNDAIIHAAYIPVVPTIGEELIPFDNERRWVGMYEPNTDAQNVFNYAASNAVESMAQEPRSTWVIAEGQEVGHERELLLANIRNFPYVRYKPTALGDHLVPEPKRTQVDSSKLGMSMEMLSMADQWIHSGTAFFEPSLGKSSPNVKTKGGTLALQQQGDQSNSHWLDNQAELSMQYEARVVLSMIPFYYDRPGRTARVLGAEDKDSKPVILNRPYEMQGKRPRALPFGTPEEKRAALARVSDPNDAATLHNLRNGGVYGLTVEVGKGYKSRVDQGADELGQLFQAEPQLFQLLGDIYLRFRDFPGHEEAADRIHKMLPPQLQDQQDGQDPKIQLEQAKQALQAMQAKLQELEPERMKAQTQATIAKLKSDTDKAIKLADVQIQIMKDATSVAVAEIGAMAKGVQSADLETMKAAALAQQHASDHVEAAKQRAHEAGMAAAAALGGQVASEADHQRGLEAGDAAHQQALEQGAAAGDQARATQAEGAQQGQEAAAQAAELAPATPAAGAGGGE